MGWESDWFLFGLILLKVLVKVDFFVYVFEVFLETATTSPKPKKKRIRGKLMIKDSNLVNSIIGSLVLLIVHLYWN